jgi:hypothetical protein
MASGERKGDAVLMQVLNFQLHGLEEARYREVCEEKAPAFTSGPGLLSKIWLADHSTNTYGGVYFECNRRAKQTFSGHDPFRGIAADLQLKNVTSRDFDVLQTPTEVTVGSTRARA